jgi:hypothetical protein
MSGDPDLRTGAFPWRTTGRPFRRGPGLAGGGPGGPWRGHGGQRLAGNVATQLIAQGRVLVDGVRCLGRPRGAPAGGHPHHRLPAARGGDHARSRRALRGGLRRRRGGRGGQAGGAGGPSGSRARRRDAGRRAAGPFPRSGQLVAAGVCPPDRPGHCAPARQGDLGLLAVARTEAAYRALVDQLADRTMERRYLALVEGRRRRPGRGGGAHRALHPHADENGGHRCREAGRTGYTVLERRPRERPTTLVELALQSGRTHQIRVHMAAIGHPVVGDARYGEPDKRLGSGASSCTPSSWPSRIRSRAAEFTSPCPRTCRPTSARRSGRRQRPPEP